NAAIHAAALVGARKVIAVDIDQRKLDLAREFGATDLVDSSQVNPVSAVRELTGGFGADVTVEAVGHPDVMKQAFHARDHAGTMIQIGVPNPKMRIDVGMLDFYGRGGALRPSWYGDCLPTRDFPKLIDLYLRGRYDLDRFVSETIALDQVEEAFAKMQRNEVLRSVVVFPDA
ncbi:MAG TPA: zinc-binding dehydrogenase, partial [Actinomycetota bacterium]|nr:zinc-binding dehydrogenase [Actinomycetota bacterium]